MFATPASAPTSSAPPASAPTASAPTSSALAQRLAGILDLLCRAVADQGGRKLLAVPLVLLVWGRLRHLSTRILRLAAKIEAGTPPPRPRRPRAPRPGRPKPPLSLPRGRSWLIRLVRQEAAAAGSQLRYLLAEPDMRALVAADPRMGRLLRPLCHALGVTPPPEIAKPATVPAPAAAAPVAAPAAPAAAGTVQPSLVPVPPQAGMVATSSGKRRQASGGRRRARPSHGPPPAPG